MFFMTNLKISQSLFKIVNYMQGAFHLVTATTFLIK